MNPNECGPTVPGPDGEAEVVGYNRKGDPRTGSIALQAALADRSVSDLEWILRAAARSWLPSLPPMGGRQLRSLPRLGGLFDVGRSPQVLVDSIDFATGQDANTHSLSSTLLYRESHRVC